MQGLHEAWILSRVFQGFSQFVDRCVEALVEVNVGVGGPELLAQLVPRDHVTRFLEQ